MSHHIVKITPETNSVPTIWTTEIASQRKMRVSSALETRNISSQGSRTYSLHSNWKLAPEVYGKEDHRATSANNTSLGLTTQFTSILKNNSLPSSSFIFRVQ